MGDVVNESILEQLGACISTGQGVLGGYVSVGITSEYAKSTLKKIIIESIKGIRTSTDELNKNIEKSIEEDRENIKNYYAQNASFMISLKKLVKMRMENDEKSGSFAERMGKFFSENIPVIGKVTKKVIDFSSFLYEQQNKWIYWQQELNNSGVFLNDGLSSLSEKSNNVGMYIDDFVKTLSNNSQLVAKLGGIYGNGTRAFSNLYSKIIPVGKELGIFNKELTKLSSSIVSEVAVMYDSTAYGMQRLADRTQNYIKWLDALSKATGKSRDQILEETKQRSEDLRWRIWMMDSMNQKKAAIWSSMGLDMETQQGLAFGMPNKGTLSLAISSPEMYNIAKSIEEARDDVQLEQSLKEGKIIAEQLRPEITKQLEFLKSSGLFNTSKEYIEFLGKGLWGLYQLSTFDDESMSKILHPENLTEEEKADIDMIKALMEKEQKKAEAFNKWTDTLRLDSTTIGNIVNLETGLLDIMTSVLDLVKSLIVPGSKSIQGLFNDMYKLFSNSDGNLVDRIGTFIAKHPIFSGFVILGTLPGIISGGFNLVGDILGIGVGLLKNLISVGLMMPTLLAPVLSSFAMQLLSKGVLYEVGINAANKVERYWDRFFNFAMSGYEKYNVLTDKTLSDAEREEKLKRIEELNEARNIIDEKNATNIQKMLPGVYYDNGEFKFSSGFLKGSFDELENKLFSDTSFDISKYKDNYIKSINDSMANLSSQITPTVTKDNDYLQEISNKTTSVIEKLEKLINTTSEEMQKQQVLYQENTEVQKEKLGNDRSNYLAISANI